MHIHPVAFAIPAAALGIALGYGLIQYARRDQRRLRVVRYALALVGVAWLTVDLVLDPAHRWVTGVFLVPAALLLAGGYGYERFRRSKARPER